MTYVALYRQWRPQDFDNLVGQEHISKTLRNALQAGKIAHAYLFTGPRGTGKTSTAKILAKALNCVKGPTPEPCNACSNCGKITAGVSMDVFEIDAASNRGIDEIRDLRETVKFAPVEGKYKVYIIDEVHMLTSEAFNALLKTLEEPPGHVVFVLATTEPHKIPATIHSRCQRYDFRRIGVREIEGRMAAIAADSRLQITPEALRLIAVHADGGMRDALSVLDQCATLDGDVVTAEDVRQLLGLVGQEWVWRLTEALAGKDAPGALLILDELITLGKDVRQVIVELTLHIRSLMLYKAAPDLAGINIYTEDITVLESQSSKFSHDEIVKMLDILHSAANEVKWAPEPRIPAEMALLDVCRRREAASLEELVERVAALEARLQNSHFKAVDGSVIENKKTAAAQVKVRSAKAQTESMPLTVKADAPSFKTPEPPVRSSGPVKDKVVGDVGKVWDEVLKELIASGKRSVHACVAQGRLVSLSGKQAVVQFAAAFPKERTEKEDYRTIIETILGQVTGEPVRLQCVLGSGRAPESQSPPNSAKAAAAAGGEENDEQHPVLRQALMMFGGKIIKEDSNKEV